MKSLTSIKEILTNCQELKEGINSLFSENINFPYSLYDIHGSFFSHFLQEFSQVNHLKSAQAIQYQGIESYNLYSSDILIVAPTEFEINNIANDLAAIYPEAQVFILPAWGTLPYRPVPKRSVIFGKRAGFLSELVNKDDSINFNKKTRIFIISQRAFISPLPDPAYIKNLSFKLKKGQQIDTTKLAQKLTEIGYIRVPKVSVKGEFSLRGEVIDIFLPNEDYANRIIFDFDTIESFKLFESDSQKTVGSKEEILIYPMKEVLWGDDLIEKLIKYLDDYNESAIGQDSNLENENSGVHLPFTPEALAFKNYLISELKTQKESFGEEFYYDILWDKRYTILDYLAPKTFVFFYDNDRMLNAQLNISREYQGLYRKSRETLPVLPPDITLLNFEELQKSQIKALLLSTIAKDNQETDESSQMKFGSEPGRSFFGNLNFMKEELTKLQNDDWNIFIYTDNENQNLRIKEIFKSFIEVEDKKPVVLIPKAISAGFIIPKLKLLVIQENEIFGRRKYTVKTSNKVKSKAIDTFVELSPGDYVVHVNWGIGLFHGIERVKALDNERDYIKLEYAEKEFAFVPIEQVNLVQRYIGNEGDKPKLDTIGSKSWEKRKSKVQKAVEDLAQKLIDLYSRRKASVGYAFPKDTEWQTAFEAAFPYEDTPDQITVTEEIKKDMEKPLPMDRLVCGDVGYGKTEIAMRAAFKAVMGGKQVAFLAPTTILAEQHFDSCQERFKNFPIKIAHMSRFVTPAEQKKILAKLEKGEIDILIGTHRIIQKDVKFKNLGLMIIDEEQRFGVKDKEKLKTLKNNIDCLTLSATPIPRTLHMSLLKIRDMSLLTTPPQNRQPVETVIDEYTEDRVAAAIRKEIDREGQIFYLHNRVEDLLEIRRKIERICPEILVEVAHGQMTSQQLDDIFHRFKMGAFHLLIATTIIENGIDIPNVNTIIIDRADMYGVSQLYQLRGRVGRSDRQAYAYLLYPENKALSEIAMKRLQVISDFTELGSGFKIAMKDLEIRGAGNLLGRDQSGDVYSVGFDLYVKLLNEAVNRLTAQKDYKEENEVLMELEYTGFIPDSYIVNPQIKMEIYKKIAAITSEAEFDSVLAELIDRFGPIPDEVSSLLALAEIRILCKKLGVKSIKERQGEVKVEFSQVSNLSIDKILKLIHDNPDTIRLNSQMPNMIFIKLGKIGLKEKSEFIREKLSRLSS
ncbi:MAG: transcription-repair coupling factor [Treponema sp.]|nr:transcription-repair coupling factor [Treponema sp.]